MNVHKTSRRRSGRLLNVLCTFNLCPVSTGLTCYIHIFDASPMAVSRFESPSTWQLSHKLWVKMLWRGLRIGHKLPLTWIFFFYALYEEVLYKFMTIHLLSTFCKPLFVLMTLSLGAIYCRRQGKNWHRLNNFLVCKNSKNKLISMLFEYLWIAQFKADENKQTNKTTMST